MAELHIYADDLIAKTHDAIQVNALVDVVRELAPNDDHIISTDQDLFEVVVRLESVSGAQAERFISRIVELSRTSGRSFTINTNLNEKEHRAHLKRDTNYVPVDGSVIHVRPTEGPVLHAYFQYLFGAL